MKKILIIILFYFYTFLLFGQSGIDGYVRIFDDDFEGNKLQENLYTHDMFSILAHKCACIDMESDNYKVENGSLNLRAYYTPGKTCADGTSIRDYTDQEIKTKRYYKYGRFKIYAKIPKGSGLFPAFWLFGGSSDPDYAYTEIDFEVWTLAQKAKSQIWLYPVGGGKTLDFSHDWWYLWQPNTWHMYTIDWRPDYLKVFVDGICVSVLNNNYGHGAMQVVIGLQLDNNGDSGVGYPIASEYPYYMPVDYFTVDYPIDKDEIISVNNYASLASENTVYAGKQITMSANNGSVIVKGKPDQWHDGSNLDLIATNNIILKPGFHAEETSNFRAWTVDAVTFQKNLKSAKKGTDLDQKIDKYTIIPGSLDTTLVSNNTLSAKVPVREEVTEKNNSFNIYPNPAHDKINVSLPDNEKATIVTITDLSGRVIKRFVCSEFSKEIDLSGLTSGLYFINVYAENKLYRKMISKD